MNTTSLRWDEWAPLVVSALLALAGASAEAQTPGCDKFKAELGERIQKRSGPVTIESVPSSEPLPPGARVVGNCSGGAWKLVLKRGGPSAPRQAAAAPTTAAASAADASQADERRAVPAAGGASKAVVAVRAPLAASAAVSGASSTATAAAASEPQLPAAGTASAPASSAPASGIGDVAETPDAREPAEPLAAAEPDAPDGEWPRRAPVWLWGAGGVIGLLVLVLLGRWISHRRAFDSSGLPRGPKLN